MAKKQKTSSKEETSLHEMQGKILDLNKEIFAMRNELALNRKIEKPHLLRAKRKEKARLLTFITQKQNSRSKGVA